MSDGGAHDEQPPQDLAAAADHLPLPLVPPDDSRRLREMFHSNRSVVGADLVTDTRDSPALAGARGAGVSAWSMSYRAGPCDIVLDLMPRGAAVELGGQLLCPDPTPDGVLRVFKDDALVSSTSTDEFGQFDLGTLPPASYAITIARSDQLIEMTVDLNERPSS